MSTNASQAFWICHECGAQMRPLTVDGVSHCASCNGEFIEILDSNINPDPYFELPPPPPIRPTGQEPPSQHNPGLAEGNFMSSLFGNIFGAAVRDPGGSGQQPGSQRPGSPSSALGTSPGRSSGSSGGRGRTLNFNLPGGGRGQVMFGSFGGNGIGIGAIGSGDDGGLGMPGSGGDLASFFPGFGPPPHLQRGGNRHFQPLGQNDAMSPDELIRSMLAALTIDGDMPQIHGIPGRANLGDYVLSQQGFDQVLEQLMRAAGPQGPLPASDIVINGLPKFKLTEESLETSQFKDCPVCKEEFTVGEEVKRIPCKHIFHPDCVDPWLKVNGSCPVCRFSLVPDESNGPPRTTGTDTDSPDTETRDPQQGSYVSNVLRRLWGQTGTNSDPSSPTTEDPPDAAGEATAVTTSGRVPSESPPPASAAPQAASGEPVVRLSTDIPAEYTERHRRREREARESLPDEDLD
ncbi:hypothetical protein BD324DRAFT_680220 [Kockovaella imperatae]|uniref:RING-type E3 ubiquitin transferase n=1 Tax=Kockovaella imperatae TaxID=4999 RepID=A0A1Y1UKA2_9TREE|nr:hypothetical protein BD324DRAFT_680220 [Kockovaella imperatae]ORX38490.1 hypothetical protein BD324DRAFT_680220 [Kockovaella imperatae]